MRKGRWRISSPCQPWRANCFSTVVRHRHGSTTLSRHFRDPPEQRILADRETPGDILQDQCSQVTAPFMGRWTSCTIFCDRMKAGPSIFEPTWGPPSRDVLGESHQHPNKTELVSGMTNYMVDIRIAGFRNSSPTLVLFASRRERVR